MTIKQYLVLLWFTGILWLPVAWLTQVTTMQTVNVFIADREAYVRTQAALIENTCKKYGNHATFNISYNGKATDGTDGCTLWSSEGELVKVYFNKTDLRDHGIISELVLLMMGRWLLLSILSILFIKWLRAYRLGKTERLQ